MNAFRQQSNEEFKLGMNEFLATTLLPGGLISGAIAVEAISQNETTAAMAAGAMAVGSLVGGSYNLSRAILRSTDR